MTDNEKKLLQAQHRLDEAKARNRDKERKARKRDVDKLSRELVKETLNLHTNQYRKLANLHYDKADQSFGYDDVTQDDDVDALDFCYRAENLFELYQQCANRKQVETICQNYLHSFSSASVSAVWKALRCCGAESGGSVRNTELMISSCSSSGLCA